MTSLPKPPLGGSAEANWMRRLLNCIAERTPKGGRNLRVIQNSDGYSLEQISGGGGAAGKVNYRGTFDITESYKEGDIVRSRSAPYPLGVWICVEDNPASNGSCIPPQFPEPEDADPDDTNVWELLSLGVKAYNACRNGQTVTVYINLMEV